MNFAKLVDWNEVIDLNKGYICDDEVVILAYITIEKAFGVRLVLSNNEDFIIICNFLKVLALLFLS